MANRQDHTDLFRDVRTGLTNAQADPELRAALAEYEWGPPELAAAAALLAEAERRARRQTTEYAEQKAATRALTVAYAAAQKAYARHIATARSRYEPGEAAYDTLGLAGERPERPDDLVMEARRFYEAIQADAAIQARLATRKLNAAAVTAAVAGLDAVDRAQATQADEQGEAQRATRVRDDVVGDLAGVWEDFVAVAKLAFADEPQLRERLGIFERS